MLQFRIPGQHVHRLNGSFQELAHGNHMSGFIVSAGLHQKYYQFQEGHSTEFTPLASILPHEIDKTHFMESIEFLISRMASTPLKKAVLSRVIHTPASSNQIESLFQVLCQSYPEAFVYHFSDATLGHWIGASPEVLLERSQERCKMVALAGTQRAEATDSWGQKEVHEQQVVSDFILEKLKEIGIQTTRTSPPFSASAGPVKHLKTEIEFDATPGYTDTIVQTVHPTPAVCGAPRESAMEAILDLETHERGLYTGIVGWFSPQETYCYVNLRCAQLIDDQLCSYVGAGITMDSVPELEWYETENKSKTLLSLLKNNKDDDK
jgi:isochorismate synthase